MQEKGQGCQSQDAAGGAHASRTYSLHLPPTAYKSALEAKILPSSADRSLSSQQKILARAAVAMHTLARDLSITPADFMHSRVATFLLEEIDADQTRDLMRSAKTDVVIIGGGIGGLTLALSLYEKGIRCRVYEAAEDLQPLGVGINLLPHAMKVLTDLQVNDRLEALGVTPHSAAFYNRFGQLIHRESLGRAADYAWPQVSIHRGDLQMALAAAVTERLGQDALVLGHQCTGVEQGEGGARAWFRRLPDGESVVHEASVLIGCDGVHSQVRESLFPGAAEIRYSGVHMWRGTTVMDPILDGSTMIRAGWLDGGKLVIYPIRHDVDGEGRQLINWVAEVQRESYQARDWNRSGNLDDFIHHFEDWQFDWLDAPTMLRSAETVLEYPMVDQKPLEQWTVGYITLLGDAAHAMVPRGSNGAGQAILDAVCLADALALHGCTLAALTSYEEKRRPMTTAVVEMNNADPPDAILRLVFERTGDQPFDDISDVVSPGELEAISDRYKAVAGYSRLDLG